MIPRDLFEASPSVTTKFDPVKTSIMNPIEPDTEEDHSVVSTRGSAKTPLSNSRHSIFPSKPWQELAVVFCVFFGTLLILNIHPAGDGMWFWYATMLRGGHLLYAEMHLALQPLFIQETAMFQALLGESWLASKVPAFLQLTAYCVGLLLVSRYSSWKDWQKAIVLSAAFCLTTYINFYRFDDYHITTDCFQIYSIYLLLRLRQHSNARRTWGIVFPLGLLSGLALANRLNDGAALLLGVGLAAAFSLRSRRLLNISVLSGVAAITLLTVILATGDSLRDWAVYSILAAAKIKGGASSVLKYPVHLPRAIFFDIRHTRHALRSLLAVSGVMAICGLFPHFVKQPRSSKRTVAAIFFGIVLLALLKLTEMRSGLPEQAVSEGLILLLYGLVALVAVRAVFTLFHVQPAYWDPRELLLLIPFGQLLSGAMTSAQTLPDFYPATAVALLVLPIAAPLRLRAAPQRAAYLAMAAVLLVGTVYYKRWKPYFWHNYNANVLFHERRWYVHPDYGPMYIDSKQLEFMQQLCGLIARDPGPKQLLSLPYPYPNYFCHIVPWDGYIQTWFDTSSRDSIDQLEHKLATRPPYWIVYQRQLLVMRAHELAFNRGQPLPQRDLDRLIMDNLASGRWTAKAWFFQGSEWYLIRT